MKTRRLLYLSAHQMVAYQWHAGALTREAAFEATPGGLKEFSDYLALHAKSVFMLLSNVAEEGYQIDSIPFLRGADRQAILERKLGQLFFNAELTGELSLGFEKSQRKNERIMLAALTNTDFFLPWLECLLNAGAALSGLYSLPFLAPLLLKKIKRSEDQCLLLSVQDQSIRQSYLEQGELHFSRLTPLQNSSIGGIAQTFASEALKLQQYLASQRLVGRNQPITAHILAHPAAFKAIRSSCIDSGPLRFNLISLEDCATQTGLKSPLPDTHSEMLFLHLLATSPPRIQFAGEALRHDYHLRRIRSTLLGLGALTLLGCLAFSGKLLFENITLAEETQILQSEAALFRQRYEAMVKTLPPIPTSHDTLHRVIDRSIELNRHSISPGKLYSEISRALHAVPSVEIESIDWKASGIDPRAPGTPAGTTAATANDSETALVRGTIRFGEQATPRQLLAVFDQFVEALKSRPGIQVEILKRPFDIESAKPLKGDNAAFDEHRPRAFDLQVSRRIAP